MNKQNKKVKKKYFTMYCLVCGRRTIHLGIEELKIEMKTKYIIDKILPKILRTADRYHVEIWMQKAIEDKEKEMLDDEIKFLKILQDEIKKEMDGLCCEYDEDDKFYGILENIGDLIFYEEERLSNLKERRKQ